MISKFHYRHAPVVFVILKIIEGNSPSLICVKSVSWVGQTFAHNGEEIRLWMEEKCVKGIRAMPFDVNQLGSGNPVSVPDLCVAWDV